jgi:putative transposase
LVDFVIILREKKKLRLFSKNMSNHTIISPPDTQAIITCKNCGSSAVVKYGKYGQQQKYWCKSCRKKFKADKCTFHMKTAVAEIGRFLNLFYGGTGVEEIRRILQAESGHLSARSSLFKWLDKYAGLAVSANGAFRPMIIGETWIADETVIRIAGRRVWIFDIQDEKTRFLLASHITPLRSAAETRLFLQEAYQNAGAMPGAVITDSYISFLNQTQEEPVAVNRQSPFNPPTLETDTQRIVPFHTILRERTTVVKRMKSLSSAALFNRTWMIYYNFFRPHEALNGKTPAVQAGIEAPCRCWEDVVKKKLRPDGERTHRGEA